MALSNTTLGMLVAMINSSILLIALPDIFRGIGVDPLRPGAALMGEQHLAARRKRRRRGTTRPAKGRWRAPDLVVKRDFPATQVNKKWYGDGTEVPTDEGKLYLASVLDMASRRIVGFALGEQCMTRSWPMAPWPWP